MVAIQSSSMGSGSAHPANGAIASGYSQRAETEEALKVLLSTITNELPDELRRIVLDVEISSTNPFTPYFPCPLKQTEAIGALKAVEAGVASAIADIRYGKTSRKSVVDLDRASCFLFSAYTATVGGLAKQDPGVKGLLKDTDLLKAQAIQYRRLSANLYKTKVPDEYYHIHGSLEATSTLNMIGLEGHRPDMTDYRGCIDLIESHVMQFTAEELESMNAERKQAGVTCLRPEQFAETAHGQTISSEPPYRVEQLEATTPPVEWPRATSNTPKPQILSGIKVLELCRIIAGPSIGRGLAEYGASVIKVTSPNLSDVPFFQVDGNVGKHACDLDLKLAGDRATFEQMLDEADVVIDGYRPGSLERLGYGPQQLADRLSSRGKGIVYVAEDCFGHVGEWAPRPGWQQIADCATGVAWVQGTVGMGLEEPVIPPFPMSDYGTGCLGTIAALTGLYRRAISGGSYSCTTSLVQYDMFLLSLGTYSPAIVQQIRETHDDEFFELRHADSVDEVGRRALKSMKRVHPQLFDASHYHESYSRGFQAPVCFLKPVNRIEGTWNGFLRSSRPNGFDAATWEGWEVDHDTIHPSL